MATHGTFALLLSVFVGFLMELIAGVVYSIGVWGPDLAAHMNWPLEQLPTMTAALNIGLYVSPDVAGFVDFFGKSGREWPAALLAAALLGSGWMILWFGASGYSIPLPIQVFAFWLIGHGNFAAFSGPLRANVRNFGSRRSGLIDGLFLSGFSLSSVLVSQLYIHLFGSGRIPSFLSVLGGVSIGVALLSALYTKHQPMDDTADGTSTKEGYTVLTAENLNDHMPWFAALRSNFLWRLWAVLALSGGANIWFVQSAGLLVESAVGVSRAELVTLFCVGNVAGRQGGAGVADTSRSRFNMNGSEDGNHVLLTVPSALLMALVAILVLFGNGMAFGLRVAYALAGLSEGLLFACWPGSVRFSFGQQRFSMNISLVGTALGVGSAAYLKVFGSSLDATLHAFIPTCCLAALLGVSLSVWKAGRQ